MNINLRQLLKVLSGGMSKRYDIEEVFVGINKAANLLGVSTKTLREWDNAKKLIADRTIGGHRRYSLTALDAFNKDKN